MRAIAAVFMVVICGCHGTPTSRTGPLTAARLTYEFSDVGQIHFQSLAHSIGGKDNLRLDFSSHERSEIGRAVLEDKAEYLVHRVDGPGEFHSFSITQLRTQDSLADDRNHWELVLGSFGDLGTDLLSGGKNTYLIIAYRGTSPPNSALRVSKFDEVKTSKRNGSIAFELKFSHAGGQPFPTGSGSILGVLPY